MAISECHTHHTTYVVLVMIRPRGNGVCFSALFCGNFVEGWHRLKLRLGFHIGVFEGLAGIIGGHSSEIVLIRRCNGLVWIGLSAG